MDKSALLALQRSTHTTLHVLAASLADLELTASEISALAHLADGSSRTVSELCAAVGSRPSTLTGVLDRLDRREYITRSSRPGDRRSVVVDLTPPGRAAAGRISRAILDLERRALRGLSDQALEGFHAVLDALAGTTT